MSICSERVECVCKDCGAYKLKRDWCEPCKLCDNFQLRARKFCLEENMKARELKSINKGESSDV